MRNREVVIILLDPAVALEDFCLQPQLVSNTGEAQATCLLLLAPGYSPR